MRAFIVLESAAARMRSPAPLRGMSFCVKSRRVSDAFRMMHSAMTSAPSRPNSVLAKFISRRDVLAAKPSTRPCAPAPPKPLRLKSSEVTLPQCSMAWTTLVTACGPKLLSLRSKYRSDLHCCTAAAKLKPPCSPSALERRESLVSTRLAAIAAARIGTAVGSAPTVTGCPCKCKGSGTRSKSRTKWVTSQRSFRSNNSTRGNLSRGRVSVGNGTSSSMSVGGDACWAPSPLSAAGGGEASVSAKKHLTNFSCNSSGMCTTNRESTTPLMGLGSLHSVRT
mmetsp:Transcript_6319/g.17347  ORF Transcript_6319/g.17347 Transcript_6319/m.17347 type:complete len:280 (-) Transcript_6319:160-999(-)